MPGVANSFYARITMAARSGELSDVKTAIRSELQTLTLVVRTWNRSNGVLMVLTDASSDMRVVRL